VRSSVTPFYGNGGTKLPDKFNKRPHRGDEKRFIVRPDEKLTAFMELESAISQRRLTRAKNSMTLRA
jgi:hypothetical protein